MPNPFTWLLATVTAQLRRLRASPGLRTSPVLVRGKHEAHLVVPIAVDAVHAPKPGVVELRMAGGEVRRFEGDAEAISRQLFGHC